jgi:hypothetical protein
MDLRILCPLSGRTESRGNLSADIASAALCFLRDASSESGVEHECRVTLYQYGEQARQDSSFDFAQDRLGRLP